MVSIHFYCIGTFFMIDTFYSIDTLQECLQIHLGAFVFQKTATRFLSAVLTVSDQSWHSIAVRQRLNWRKTNKTTAFVAMSVLWWQQKPNVNWAKKLMSSNLILSVTDIRVVGFKKKISLAFIENKVKSNLPVIYSLFLMLNNETKKKYCFTVYKFFHLLNSVVLQIIQNQRTIIFWRCVSLLWPKLTRDYRKFFYPVTPCANMTCLINVGQINIKTNQKTTMYSVCMKCCYTN